MKRAPLIDDQRGGLIIEVLISIMFMMVMSAALLSLARANAVVTTSSRLTTQAVSLARESMEQVYAMKRTAWADVNVPAGTYRVRQSGNAYVLQPDTSTGEVIGATFTRTITLETALRDQGRLVTTGGMPDPNVRLVTVRVSWIDRDQPQDVTLAGYVTNWKEATP